MDVGENQHMRRRIVLNCPKIQIVNLHAALELLNLHAAKSTWESVSQHKSVLPTVATEPLIAGVYQHTLQRHAVRV